MIRSRLRRPTLWGLAGLVPWVALVIAARKPIRDNSFLWHVRAGTVQLDHGSVLTSDPFSFTAGGEPWRTQSWLLELLCGFWDRLVGLDFVTPLVVVLGSLFFAGLGVLVYRVTRSGVAATVALVLGAWLSVGYLNPRPALATLAIFPLVVLAERDPRLRWTLPLLFWVWASVHGGFVLGGLYLVVRIVETGEWRRFGGVVVAGAATLLTAHGWGVLEMLLAFVRNRDALDLIQEWAPPDLVSVQMLPLLIAILLLVLAGIRDRIRPRQLLTIAVFLGVGLAAQRSVPVAFVALAPFWGGGLEGLEEVRFGRTPMAAGGVVAVAILALPWLLPMEHGLDPERFPIELTSRLEGRHLFHDDVTGGYLIYAAWPVRQVLVDDRAELYGEFLAEYVSVRRARPGWEAFLERWDVDEALVRDGEAIAEALRRSGWEEAAESHGFVLLRP